MSIKMEEMPAALARFLSYKLSIQGASEKTVYEYSIDLTGFFRYVFRHRKIEDQELDLTSISDEDIAQISSQNIYEYLLYTATVLQNGAASRARKLCAIRGFFKFLATKEKSISENPAKDIDAPAVKHALPRYLSLEESRMLLDAAKKEGSENAKRDYLILTLFLNCGMRVSELAGISLSDLSSNLSELIVTGKGNKQRLIYLNEACVGALKDYLKQRKGIFCKDENALFVSRNSRKLSVKTVQWIVYKYLKIAGLEQKQYSAHKLRHTAATLLYGTGKVDVRVLKDILGHEQLNTTQIYTHLSDESMKNAMLQNPLNDNE